ncbi:protein YgfX [Microbulbifer aggregans]|uniref:protein YgfX n=1 Tax=Microbulbifer aggregans TaxID=1769779 RepID=UPI00299CD7B5|nr:protein YgfX [Microbulbifer aggregans]
MTTPACRTETPVSLPQAGPAAAIPGRSARLACDLVPSRLLRGLLILATCQSLLLLWLSPLYWLFACLGSILVIAFTYLEFGRLRCGYGRLSTGDRRWYWQSAGGERREFCFQGELVAWNWLIVINGRYLDGGRLRLVVARDSVSPDDWRRLQVALRYSRTT